MTLKHIANPDSPVSKALLMLKRIRRLEGSALICDGNYLHGDFPEGSDAAAFLETTCQLFDRFVQTGEKARELMIGFENREVLFLFRYPVILCLFYDRDKDRQSIEAGGNQFLRQFGPMLGICDQPEVKPVATGKDWDDEDFTAALREEPVKAPAGVQQEISNPITIPALKSMIPHLDVDEPGQVVVPAPVIAVLPETNVFVPEIDPAWGAFLDEIENLISKVVGSVQAKKSIKQELDKMSLTTDRGIEKSEYLSFGLRLTGKIRDRKVRRLIENELGSLLETFTPS